MKKLLSLLCAVFIIVNTINIMAQSTKASYNQSVDTNCLSLANKLLEVVLGDVPFKEDSVTRGEFVNTVADIMNVTDGIKFESIYNDVTTDYKYSLGITAAAKLKWVSVADKFNPDKAIEINEALKIVVCAANYGDRAMHNGGYPNGFIIEANRLDLFEGFENSDNVLQPDEAKIMLYNMLRVSYLETVYTESTYGSGVSYNPTEKSILSVLYDIVEIEGIVDETPYNSYTYNTNVYTKEKYISLNGISYKYPDASYDLLGKHATAFVEENTNIVVALDIEENDIVIYDLYDLQFNGNKLQYCPDEGKIEDVKWYGGIALYNGRTLKNFTADYLDKDGFAEFIDNDSDGDYEVVHITAYEYVTVGNIDRINRRIGDVNSEVNSFDFSQCDDESVVIYDADGEEMSVYGLESGMVLSVIAPEDMSFGTIRIVNDSVKGAVASVGEDFFEIGDSQYKTTNYFENHNATDVLPGVTYQFYLGYNGRIITMTSSSDKYEYGFLIDAIMENGMNDSVLVKLYSDDGKMNVFEIADKFYADDNQIVKSTQPSDELEILNLILNTISDDTKRVVRYKVNSEGKLNRIDFPEVYDYKTYEALTADEDNKLLYYPEYYKSLRYRNSAKLFNGDVYVGNASCFMIPSDLDEEEKYFMAGVSSSVMTHDTNYNPHIYDIDEYGSAGVVVLRGKNENLSGSDGSYLVEEIRSALDADGVQMKLVSCWYNGKVYRFYLPDDVPVVKNSKKELEPGDVIRVKLDSSNHIYKLQVDFDYGKFGKNDSLSSGNYQNKLSSVSYWDGLAYSYDKSSNMVQLSNEYDEYGEHNFSAYSLKTLNANTTNILSFDCKSKKVRPVTRDEIKTYREFGENCDYIVMRTDYDACRSVIIYVDYAER